MLGLVAFVAIGIVPLKFDGKSLPKFPSCITI